MVVRLGNPTTAQRGRWEEVCSGGGTGDVGEERGDVPADHRDVFSFRSQATHSTTTCMRRTPARRTDHRDIDLRIFETASHALQQSEKPEQDEVPLHQGNVRVARGPKNELSGRLDDDVVEENGEDPDCLCLSVGRGGETGDG
mgnify:CR=1 FL=1